MSEVRITLCDLTGSQAGARDHYIILDGDRYDFDCIDDEWDKIKSGLSHVTDNPMVRVTLASIRRTPRGDVAMLSKPDRASLRTWMGANGYEYPGNGRVKPEIVQLWRDAGSPRYGPPDEEKETA